MKIGPFTLTRDSLVLWLPVLGAVVTYLMASPPPTQWDYYAWLRAIAAIVAASSTKLMTSRLPGAGDPPKGSVDLAKIGPALLLAVALGGAALTLPACAAKTAPALTPGQKAAAILQRVDELQNAVISANTLTPGSIPDAVAVPLVRFCVESAKVLRASPDGVLPAIAAEWASVKLQVPLRYRQLPAVAAAFVAVDIAFAEIGQSPASVAAVAPETEHVRSRIRRHLHAVAYGAVAAAVIAGCVYSAATGGGSCWGG